MDLRRIGAVLAVFLLVLTLLDQIRPLEAFVERVRHPAGDPEREAVSRLRPAGREEADAGEPVAKTEQEKLWLERIREEAEKRRIPPVDARVDPVWKAIPGYNGIEVDVARSFALTKERGGVVLAFRETEPRVRLEDLGPHPIYKGNPAKPMVSFMINVAWGNEHLPSMLRTLEEAGVKATFFFDGSWLRKNLDLAREIGARGHELSNHAYSHRNMSQLNAGEQAEEILKTQKLLEEELKVRNGLFAPPSGDYSEETVRIAHRLGLKTILWTLDTVDWKHPPPEAIVRKIASRVEPGSLILMHPTDSASRALPGMIAEIRRKGLQIGTVSELLSSQRVEPVERTEHF